jgi:hypothetical protein
VRNARDLGFKVGVDLDLAEEVGEHFRKIAEQEELAGRSGRVTTNFTSSIRFRAA